MLGLGLSLALAQRPGGSAASAAVNPTLRYTTTAVQRMTTTGVSRRTTIGNVQPSAQWGATGVSGSGFGGSNPVAPTPSTARALTDPARPMLRHMFTPWQTYGDDVVIGWDAAALGGLSSVTVAIEGNVYTIPQMATHYYTDVNGDSKFFRGYCVRLDHAATLALHATGTIAVYVTATPNNPAMAPRTMGPYTIYAREPGVGVGKQYDFAANLTPSTPTSSPTSFQTIKAALDHCRTNGYVRPLLTYTESGTESPGTVASTLADSSTWAVITHAPGITVNITGSGAAGTAWRPNYDGLCFRGEGITIRPETGGANLAGTTGKFWADGISIAQTGGITALFANTLRPAQGFWIGGIDSNPNLTNLYFTDCAADGVLYGFYSAQLALGCSIIRCAGDALHNVIYFHNFHSDVNSAAVWRQHTNNDAITVAYSGAGTATLEASGAPNSTSRTVNAKVDGVSVGTFTLNTTVGGGNHTFTDLAGFINGLTNWTATVLAPFAAGYGSGRRALYISKQTVDADTLAPTTTLAATTIPVGGQTFTAIVDIHGDSLQNTLTATVNAENWGGRFFILRGTAEGCQSFFMEGAGGSYLDVCYRNFSLEANAGFPGSDSDWSGPQSHVLVWDATFSNIPIGLSASTTYAPDAYSQFGNVLTYTASWSGTADTDLTFSSCYFRQAAAPVGSTTVNCVAGNVALSALFQNGAPTDSVFLPIDGGDLEFANGYVGAYLPSGAWNLRSETATA